MITVLIGDNSFEIEQELERLTAGAAIVPERLDGDAVTAGDLHGIFAGTSLFQDERLIIIRRLSENKSVWGDIEKWLDIIDDTTHVVLVEEKLDKRTTLYKKLKEVADIREFSQWSDREQYKAEQWLDMYAREHNLVTTKQELQEIINRVGVNQWQLASALEKVTLARAGGFAGPIAMLVDDSSEESSFVVFEHMMGGRLEELKRTLDRLRLSGDEPYALFGLIAGQLFQLAAIHTGGSSRTVASDFGIHPFVVTKLKPLAKSVSLADIRVFVSIFSDADDLLKSTQQDPWIILEAAVLKVALQQKK